jgi:hypothetical protein
MSPALRRSRHAKTTPFVRTQGKRRFVAEKIAATKNRPLGAGFLIFAKDA